MEVVAEAAEIYKRGTKEAAKEAEVKSASAKIANYVSSSRTLSDSTAASTDASAFKRVTTATGSF